MGGKISHPSRHAFGAIARRLRAKRRQLQERHPVRHVETHPSASSPAFLRHLTDLDPCDPFGHTESPNDRQLSQVTSTIAFDMNSDKSTS